MLEELLGSAKCSASWLALVCCGLRDLDNAFTYLDQAITEHNDQCQVTFMAVDHRFDELREDPRFTLALDRLGLPRNTRIERRSAVQV